MRGDEKKKNPSTQAQATSEESLFRWKIRVIKMREIKQKELLGPIGTVML